jgi:hypothetical protein
MIDIYASMSGMRWGYACRIMPLLFGLSATELLEVLSALLTILGPLARLTPAKSGANSGPRLSLTSGQRVLALFGLVVFFFGVVTSWIYRQSIKDNREAVMYGGWLFLTMVFGMFAQVLVANHQNGKELFDVEAQQLLLPLLFSVVVFYSIWTLTFAAPQGSASSGKPTMFPFYTAFLNGYFWRNVMGAAKPPVEQETTAENATGLRNTGSPPGS